MNELSNLIRQISAYNNPDISYFNSFLSRFKMYRKAKSRRQKILVAAALVLCLIIIYSMVR